jgi:hypothetical protein
MSKQNERHMNEITAPRTSRNDILLRLNELAANWPDGKPLSAGALATAYLKEIMHGDESACVRYAAFKTAKRYSRYVLRGYPAATATLEATDLFQSPAA